MCKIFNSSNQQNYKVEFYFPDLTELQKEKLNVKGKLAKEGKDSYREILEKFKKELKSCSVTLFNIDVQAAVLTYKPTK